MLFDVDDGLCKRIIVFCGNVIKWWELSFLEDTIVYDFRWDDSELWVFEILFDDFHDDVKLSKSLFYFLDLWVFWEIAIFIMMCDFIYEFIFSTNYVLY